MIWRRMPALVGFAKGRSRNFIIDGVEFAVLRENGGLIVTLAHEAGLGLPTEREKCVGELADTLRALKASKEAFEKFMREGGQSI